MKWYDYWTLGSENLFKNPKQPKFNDPTTGAQDYLNQIPDMLRPFYQDYIEAGKGALPNYQQQINQLINDPSGFISHLGEGYQQSPGYKTELSDALQAAQQAQAAGGMAGSPQAQAQASGIASQMASKDYEKYLDRVLGMYGTGLQGLGGLTEMGYKAGTGYGENLGSIFQNKALLDYLGKSARNEFGMAKYKGQQQSQSDIFGAIGKILPSLIAAMA